MSPDVAATFTTLCQHACDTDATTLNVRAIEPTLVAILDLVQAHPEQQNLFVTLFLAVAEGSIKTPRQLLPFCMRTLRYPEIKALLLVECAQDQTTERFRRRMNFISEVLHAFDDPIWQDADLWEYYAHEHS
jgi:hypothetical protein